MADESSLVVALRTHIWNEDIARLARRLRHFSQNAAFIVLMDETNGPVPAENFVKLSHGADFATLGLPSYPKREVLWYNADYPLYLLRRQYPQATHYVMVEYDVAVNLDIMPMLRRAQAEAVDMIAADLTPSRAQWGWHETIKKFYAQPLRALIPFLVVSARAVDFLYQERLRLAAAANITHDSPREDWPYCETFIPTAISRLENAVLRQLADFAGVKGLRHRPEQHIDDPAMNLAGTICHPVLGGATFARRRLKHARYEAVMDPHSGLRQALAFCDPWHFTDDLLRIVQQTGDPAKMMDFFALAAAQRWPLHARPDNLALFKPASMSSAWAGYGHTRLAELAGGGNNGIIYGGFGFHTECEADPWWQVDLQLSYGISHILLFNRLDQPARCRRLRVDGSTDGVTWYRLAEKTDDRLFGGADGKPLVLQPQGAAPVRFVRLTNLEQTYFHLDEVQIFGKFSP